MTKEGVDLIVMGTKGATGAERLFMGSNTVRMITHISNRPVLAVPRAYDFQHLQRALLPTGFEHYYEPFMRSLYSTLSVCGKRGITWFTRQRSQVGQDTGVS